MLADKSIAKGEDAEATRAGFEKAISNIEPEVEALWKAARGKKTIPVNVKKADILNVALSPKHSIIPAAAILNAAGASWTFSSFEAVNFGAFVGDPKRMHAIAQRIISEAERLNVKQVAIVECGRAYRVMKQQTGKHPFGVVAFMVLIAHFLKEKNPHEEEHCEKLTCHAPCQIARNGGI